MKKVIRLTESDLMNLVKRVIKESTSKKNIMEGVDSEDQQFAEKVLKFVENKPEEVKILKHSRPFHDHRIEFKIKNTRLTLQTDEDKGLIYDSPMKYFLYGPDGYRINCDKKTAQRIFDGLMKISPSSKQNLYKDLDIDDEFSE